MKTYEIYEDNAGFIHVFEMEGGIPVRLGMANPDDLDAILIEADFGTLDVADFSEWIDRDDEYGIDTDYLACTNDRINYKEIEV